LTRLRAIRAKASTCFRASRPAPRRARADRVEDRDMQLGRLVRLDVRAVQRDRDPPLDAERLPALLETAFPADSTISRWKAMSCSTRRFRSPRRAASRIGLDLALEHGDVAVERFVAAFAASSSSDGAHG
jgi:hypothetical protein